ncbi:MAG: alginate O-acetyltransferase complex protein AlgJ [Verrucomicrobiota bacterium]|jgi:alginate O-acetyltransferase complex protein AlgJ
MKIFRFLIFICAISAALAAGTAVQVPLSEAQQKLRAELAGKVQVSEKKNAAACAEADGWLFFAAEFRLLSLGTFWGDAAAKVSRSHKPDLADPIPAIVDFQKQLKARGIELLVVPVPPKAAVYPEKILPGFNVRTDDAAPLLHRFYEELRAAGIDVLDLTPLFLQNRDDRRGGVFCKTDSHWSGLGCMLAAQAIAESVRAKLTAPPSRKEFVSEWKESQVTGDLVTLLPPDSAKPGPEKIAVRSVSEKGTGAAVQPDPNSPLLLLGDSHTLVFHDFLAERSGLVDQLAQELGFAPDLIGTRGSGATPVRISLYRHSLKNPDYLAKKKVVVWCFAAREFTEASEGWAKVPVSK